MKIRNGMRGKKTKNWLHKACTELDLSQFSIVVGYNVILTLASNAAENLQHAAHTQRETISQLCGYFFSLSLHDAATLWVSVAVVITRTTYLNVPRAFKLDYTEKKKNEKWNCTRYSRSRKLFTVFCVSACVLSCGDTVHSNSYSSTCSLTLNTYRSMCIVARRIRSKYCIFDGFLHYGFCNILFFYCCWLSSKSSTSSSSLPS